VVVVVTVPVVEAMEAGEMVVEVRAREAAATALERVGAARPAEPEAAPAARGRRRR